MSIKAHIYKIEFSDGAVYVGSTIRPVKYRVSNHITSLKTGKKPVKALIEPFKKFGWHKVDGCQTFRDAVVTSTPIEINNKRELRQHEQRHIDMIDPAKLLNIRHATGAYQEYINRPHNFMLKPVGCSAWVNLLYPEEQESRKAA